ncbi:putative ABC transporter-associated repeat protein [Actinoalloteichus hoggarensis]|uniref:Uncharacterized protein n=1 Tax=Actinoalloteichus hoggarensis TaxID=1470176 RepID=A0A221W6J5_9PSEU|nr:TIGR03773 family transporter-associated surface protein [Actinoalloteichus hoggarensis]ASO21518.1 hypothetical protein AHOG_19480 [Actinoalloteichus hoggarensis]MBB5922107.1 putative ABC transporter-associated repeat protein [Actinoalloteichus hoggarensis]
MTEYSTGVPVRPALVLMPIAAFSLVLAPSVAAAAEPETVSAEPSSERVVIADGHIDMGPRFVDGEWTVQIRDDTVEPSTWRALSDVVLQVADSAVIEVPDTPDFAFLGEPGAEVHVLPQVQQDGVLWPGWNTQDPSVVTSIDREVTWTLEGVEGPGAMVLFLNGSFGEPAVVFDSRDPYPQETGIEVDTHVHGNWAFSESGTYLLDIAMSARTDDGEEVTDRGVLRMHVGNEDPQAAFSVGLDADASREPTAAVDSPAGSAAEESAEQGASSVPWPVIGVAALLMVLAVGVLAVRRTRGAAAGGSDESGGSTSGDAR